LLLDANENSLNAPFPEAEGLHRYPAPSQQQLRALIAEWRGVRKENVFVGVGSDEGIDLLFRIFCRPGNDRVITTPPTYGMYKVSANIHDISVDEVLLAEGDFQPRVNAILEAVTSNTKMLFLCSPNNPTGNLLNPDAITQLVEEFPGIVILDEAYIDFSKQKSWSPKVVEYPNLVVLQTMSKSFGLAGIRLGITYASEDIISYMMKVKPPYNINALTSRYAITAFKNMDTIQFKADAIKKERKQLAEKLLELNIVDHVYPSDANFLLAKMKNARDIYEHLVNRNIIVRYRGDEPLCEDCLRITVGTPDENETLISALKDISL
ncbi:MAG TPA: histidinol-phosphate transaminase, partial [Balneolaceae bacterium]|nr:histidinol-phosphate transaminase [Balneolaceae bacterium]